MPPPQRAVSPRLLVVLAAVAFGTTGTAQALGPDDASSASVGLVRIVSGGALLGLLAWAVSTRRAAVPPRRSSSRAAMLLIGAASVVVYQPMFFAGTRLNGVALGTVVALGSAPVFTGALEWLLTRRFPGTRWAVATGIAVVGVVLISGLFEAGANGVDALGVAGSLGAAASYALYTIAARRLMDDGMSPVGAIGSVFGGAAALAAPFLLLVDVGWVSSGAGIATVAWLALVTIVVAYLLFGIGLNRVMPSSVSTLTLAEPLTACLLGLAVLDEALNASSWAGLVVISVGVAILALSSSRRPPDVSAVSI